MMYKKELMLLLIAGSAVAVSAADFSAASQEALVRRTVSMDQVAGRAEEAFREGNRLFVENRYQEAVKSYLRAKELFDQYRSETFMSRSKACGERIRECYYLMAEDAFALARESELAKDYDAALAAAKEAAKMCPEMEDRSKRIIAELEKRKAAAEMREETNTDKVVPDMETQEYRVQVLLRQGQELTRAGKFDDAAEKFSSVLMIDPYNATALHDLQAVRKRSRNAAQNRYRAEHRKIVTEMEWRWAIPSKQETGSVENQVSNPVQKDTDSASELMKKLDSIILPEFKAEHSSVQAVVRNLQDASRIYDPERTGVNIFLRRPAVLSSTQEGESAENMPGAGPDAMPAPAPAAQIPAAPAAIEDEDLEGGEVNDGTGVDMNIRKRSLRWALMMLCREAKLKMRVDSHAVVLAPENVPLGDMETKIFPVERSVFQDANPGDKAELKRFFVDRGVPFPQGSKIVYISMLSRLVVTNTAENLATVHEIIQLLQEDREPLVEISTKFLEVNQNDLKELGFSYSFHYNAENAPYNDPGWTAENTSSHRLSFADAGTGLLRSQANDTDGGQDWFVITGDQGGSEGLNYEVKISAENMLSSTDSLAAPRIVTLPGQRATIKMIQRRPFADEYEDAEMQTSDASSDSASSVRTFTYKGPFPDFADPTDLGITMEVEPTVDKVNGKITLQVKPTVISHVGWLTWESKPTGADSDDEIEFMRKPIFSERNIDTTVTINDGRTIVLGGVVEDRSDVISDKIPILGDLPLVGRFFQSRANKAEKRNLLIFITCRLINPDGTPFRPQEKQTPRGLPKFGLE